MAEDVTDPSAYLNPPTIVYDENEKIGYGDKFCSILVSTLVGPRQVLERKRSHFYLCPYVNKPAKLGKWQKDKWKYDVFGYFDKAKHAGLTKWLSEADEQGFIKGGITP